MQWGSGPRHRPRVFPGYGRLALLFAVLMALGQGMVAGSAQEQPFDPNWFMVVDRGNLLDENQEQSAINDAWRLNMMGTPFQVVTETAAVTPEGARQRANELRAANGIESRPGADDGILLYAAVNPADRAQVEMAFSVGPNATPRDGMTAAAIDEVYSAIVQPQLADGHPARAIVYPIRELMYLRTFVPPPVDEPTGWRASLQQPVSLIAPVLATAAVAATVLLARTGERRWKSSLLAAAVFIGGGGLLLLLGVQVHSGLGIVSALVMGVCAVLIGARLDRKLSTPASSARQIVVKPRPPGARLKTGGER